MALWILAAAASLALVLLWSVAEWRFNLETGGRTPRRPELRNIASKVILFVVLMVAIHAALDPDHDKHTFQVHGPQIARALYAFGVTLGLLIAFPTLRISAATGLMAAAVTLMETLQWSGALPGVFRWVDWVSALSGALAAAGPMWLGARRARAALARERVQGGAPPARDKQGAPPI